MFETHTRLLLVSWVTPPPLPPHRGQGRGTTRRKRIGMSQRMVGKGLQETGRRMEGVGVRKIEKETKEGEMGQE